MASVPQHYIFTADRRLGVLWAAIGSRLERCDRRRLRGLEGG
jgi:hypothetical protein